MIPRLCDHHCADDLSHQDCSVCDEARSALSTREQFLVKLYTQPPRSGDAIVILCGEDAKPRMEMGLRAFVEGGAPLIVVSGGKDNPPHLSGANAMRGALLGKGVAPDRIIVEDESQNTMQQAVRIVWMAQERGWKRLVLVASPYHLARAYLTFLKMLMMEAEERPGLPLFGAPLSESIHLVPLCSNQSPWGGSPEGTSISRAALLAIEAGKIEEYRALGHVASYDEALEYMEFWEGKP